MKPRINLGLVTVALVVALLSIPAAPSFQASTFQTGTYTVLIPVVLEPGIPVSSILTPFDANVSDVCGPSGWAPQYGKTPEIIVWSDGVELDVLAQDYDPATGWNAVLLHIEPYIIGRYAITQALTNMPMLDRVMGLAGDAAGNRYYATCVDEDDVVDPYYPPLDTWRSDIVRVIKLDPAGEVLFNVDLDTARHDYDAYSHPLINPMTFGSARLAVGGDEVVVVHSGNTDPDWNIGGARHQILLYTALDATSGTITHTSSAWCSHSFDQRLLYDGEEIVEYYLGDAYPRTVGLARDHVSHPLFHIKGEVGENNTYTRLGNVALIENDPACRHLALFVTENNAAAGQFINGPRNLAIVRVMDSDSSVDPSLPHTLTVVSNGVQQTNRLRWLTFYSSGSNLHAERPKLVGIGGDQYVVLWEEWRHVSSYYDVFDGVYGMVIDANGNSLQPARLLTDQHHLPRGDDAFLLDNCAAWMTGNADEQELYIHMVDAALNYEMVILQ